MLVEKKSFRGGVHPTNGSDKALTHGKAIVPYVPGKVRISMKQGLGPACACVVAVGDTVQQGQVIGKSNHFLSADVHASVTGQVTAVENDVCEITVTSCNLPFGNADYCKAWADATPFSREALIDALKQSGVVGMGGAGFPAGAKYETKEKITHVLINGAECEPFLTCDEHLIMEQGMTVLNGVQALKKAAGADKAVICIEDNKKHCADHLEELLKGHEGEIEIALLPTKYPQGGEKQMVKVAMGVEIPSGKLPANVGAVVSNIHSAKAAADAVFGKIPSTSRVITVTGDVKDPTNYLAPIGTDVAELLAKSGDVTDSENRVVLGGPMTGRLLGENLTAETLAATGTAVSKTSGGLIVLKGYHESESSCIRCGSCAAACPIGLSPFKIDSAIRQGKVDLCRTLAATECISCGCCSYACPAKRELTYHVVLARDTVRQKMREEAAANGK